MDVKLNRRNFLISIPFCFNFQFKKNILVTINRNGEKINYIYEEMKIEEIPFKISSQHPDFSEFIIQYSENEKYIFKKIFWNVPLLEDLNLLNKQKWNKNKKIWDDEKVELIIVGF